MASETQEKTIRVFMVEDVRVCRVGLQCDLSTFPDIDLVGESETAEGGLDRIILLKPDVVLMDLGLPGMNGIDATHQIKAFHSNIKVLIFTSHDEESQVFAAFGAGADGYCMKQNEPEQLANAIRTVHSNDAWMDPHIARFALKLFRQNNSTNGAKNNGHGLSSIQALSGHTNTNTNHNTHSTEHLGPTLTNREHEVLELLVQGKSNVEIAETIYISPHTVKTYVCNIFEKLSVNDRVQAAVKAIQSGIVTPEPF